MEGLAESETQRVTSPWGVRASGIPPSVSALEKHMYVSEGNPKLPTKKCQAQMAYQVKFYQTIKGWFSSI